MSSEFTGADPELVIVLEIRDNVADFHSAVRRIPGLEFLAESDEGTEVADEGFSTRGDEEIPLNYYVMAQNQVALRQIQSMWNQWCKNRAIRFSNGLYAWKKAFEMLKDIRPWSAQDRLRGTQLVESWLPQLAAGVGSVTCELELWYRENPRIRLESQQQFEAELHLAGCSVLDSVEIESIAYQAVLARIPAEIARRILSGDGPLINNPRVSAARPQSIGSSSAVVSGDAEGEPDAALPGSGAPLVAVLDGVPMEGHELLVGRVELDDPENFSARVEARSRVHGTGVSSAVVWGDLERNQQPLSRKVVHHPIFVTTADEQGRVFEAMPDDQLAVGVIHRALQRLLVGTKISPAISPNVKVVVLAAGHTALPYGTKVSPWGRLLDAWANSHNLLFIVSAGNHTGSISLDDSFEATLLDDEEALQLAVSEHVFSRAHERRILSPADSMNALTVGALHSDAASHKLSPMSIDVLGNPKFPSPTSALGGGFNRQMKPDVYADGGRVLYRWRFDVPERVQLDEILSSDAAPGILVATAGGPGETDARHWMQGTSAATGLVGHEAGEIAALLASGEGPTVDPRYLALATKALLVNAASWSKAEDSMAEALNISDRMAARRAASRLLGYGGVDLDRVGTCDSQRITLISTGQVLEDRAQTVELPIPQTLSGRTDWRRVSATLTWFSPINTRHNTYRQARLWLEPTNFKELGFHRSEAVVEAVKRGSTQHELFVGERRVNYGRDSALEFRVNCASGAGGLTAPVRYVIALTFEVGPESDVQVYDEIELAIRTKSRVTAVRVPTA